MLNMCINHLRKALVKVFWYQKQTFVKIYKQDKKLKKKKKKSGKFVHYTSDTKTPTEESFKLISGPKEPEKTRPSLLP